jgi:hypothetical protein
LGAKYLVVLCAGSTLPLAKQSLDEAPYKLSEAVAKLVGITFSHLSLSYWIDYLGFITEGKLAAIFIKTFSWGFPTGRSFILHQLGPIKFSGAVAGGEKDFCKGSFRTHILYFVLSFALLYFYLHRFIKNPKKLESLVVVISLL